MAGAVAPKNLSGYELSAWCRLRNKSFASPTERPFDWSVATSNNLEHSWYRTVKFNRSLTSGTVPNIKWGLY